MPRVNVPNPMGLPSLPASQSPWPPRPASTSQLPNGSLLASSINQQTNTNSATPHIQAPNLFVQGPLQGPNPNPWQGFPQQQQVFNAPPYFNVPFNQAIAANPFPLPMPGWPAPWMPGQNQPPSANNTTHVSSPDILHNRNRTEESSSQTANQEQTGLENDTRQNPGSGSSQAHGGSNASRSIPGVSGLPNSQTPVGQWRISINQTTFHSGNPAQNEPAIAPPVMPHSISSIFHNNQRPQVAGLSNPGLQNRLQQLRSYANSATTSPYRYPTMPTTLAYLLSSPSGPQALLISPAGSFATAGYNRSATSPPIFGPAQTPSQTGVGHIQPSGQQVQNEDSQPGAGRAAVPNVPQNQQADRAQIEQQDQVGELLRILLPLGGHLWLLVRLCGFVYLFSFDRGWRNTILLGICAFIVFAAQTRIFEPLLQYVWTPIRRHVEALVQVDEPAPPAARPRHDAAAPGGRTFASPQDMADRVMRRREAQQNNNPLRAAITRVERSVALFVASLVPGVGERHVAAREEARRQQREREETARREEEERQRQQQESSEGVAPENGLTAQENPARAPAEQVQNESLAGTVS